MGNCALKPVVSALSLGGPCQNHIAGSNSPGPTSLGRHAEFSQHFPGHFLSFTHSFPTSTENPISSKIRVFETQFRHI